MLLPNTKNNFRSFSVGTKEIIGIFLLFLVILVLLFPKGKIKKLALEENTNYDLAIYYLKNYLKKHPGDKEVRFALIKLYIKSGQYEKAQREIEALTKSPLETPPDIIALSFQLALQTEDKKRLLLLAPYLHKVRSVEIHRKAFYAFKEELKRDDLAAKEARWLFLNSKKQKDKLYWYRAAVELLIKGKRLPQALGLAELVQKEKVPDFHRINYYLYYRVGDYPSAAREALWLYRFSEGEDSIYWFKSALNMLVAAGKIQEADKIAKNTEDKALCNRKLYKAILRYYLGQSKLKEAQRLVIKRLNIGDLAVYGN